MANPAYLRSTDGSDSDNGSTWALAKATWNAIGNGLSGPTIYVSQSHAEISATPVDNSFGSGSLASPLRIICANDGAEPPTALATTATITTTGNNLIRCLESVPGYIYGISFIAGSGASGTANILIGGDDFANTDVCFQQMESCSLQLASTGTSSRINAMSSDQTRVELTNCTFKFAASAQGLTNGLGSRCLIRGGSLLSGGTSPTSFVLAADGGGVTFDGFDFSNASASMNIFSGDAQNFVGVARNCKLPASWSGSLNPSTFTYYSRYEMYNCDSADTNYRLWIKDTFGEILSETTLVRTSGANDGTTGLSWKFVANANAEWTQSLRSPEIVKWNETTGSAITVTVEILHDPGSPGSLNDDEIWLEVEYLGTSGTPLGALVDDSKADILAAAAAQDTSSATWTTTGLSNPTTQKLSVTFTPQEKGFIHAVVKMAKASYTVYVCPKLDIS